MRTADVKDQIELTGNDIHVVSLTAANIQQTTKDVTHDIRKFLDGIYVPWKGNAEVDVAYACVVAVFCPRTMDLRFGHATPPRSHTTHSTRRAGAQGRARARACGRSVGPYTHTHVRCRSAGLGIRKIRSVVGFLEIEEIITGVSL